MIFPTTSDLTKGKYNRYEVALATAKCARMITNEYVRQRAEAESSMSGNKETDRPLNTLIDKEVRDEKAVNIAIRRLYEGQYVITHKSVEEQEREERAVLEGIGEPAQQFAEREEDEILDGDRNADDAVLDDDAAPEDGEAAETDSGDAADAVTEDETACRCRCRGGSGSGRGGGSGSGGGVGRRRIRRNIGKLSRPERGGLRG